MSAMLRGTFLFSAVIALLSRRAFSIKTEHHLRDRRDVKAAVAMAVESGSTEGYFAFRKGRPDASIKVEIFLDPTSAACAEAWPLMTKAVKNYSSSAEFVFRILPQPFNEESFAMAKGVQVVREYAHQNTDDVVELFVEVLLLYSQRDTPTFDTNGMGPADVWQETARWIADSKSLMTAEQFMRGMADAEFERRARLEIESACEHGVFEAPSALIDGVLHLEDPANHGYFKDKRTMMDIVAEVLDRISVANGASSSGSSGTISHAGSMSKTLRTTGATLARDSEEKNTAFDDGFDDGAKPTDGVVKGFDVDELSDWEWLADFDHFYGDAEYFPESKWAGYADRCDVLAHGAE